MKIFRDRDPFQKLLVPRYLARARTREILGLGYGDMVVGHFLTDRQLSKYHKQTNPRKEDYILKSAEDRFATGIPDDNRIYEPPSPEFLERKRLENPQWKPREPQQPKPHSCEIAECTPQLQKTLIDMMLDNNYYTTQRPRVLLVVTGGTAFSQRSGDCGSLAPLLPVSDVLNRVPFATGENRRYEIAVEVPFREDSSQMGAEEQARVAEAIANGIEKYKPDGVVVGHGTDTLIETAHALSLGAKWNVPVVITGSMKAGEEKKSDIIPNLRYSLFYATQAPIRPAVYVSFGGELFEGTIAEHDSSAEDEAFTSRWGIKTGSCGKFYTYEEMARRKLRAQTEMEPRDFNDITNLGLCPRVLDPRLDLNDDYSRWSEAYAKLVAATQRVIKKEVSLGPDCSKPPKVRLPESSPEIRIITLHTRDEPLGEQLKNYVEGLTFDEGVTRAIPAKLRKGVFVQAFSGIMRNRKGEDHDISLLIKQGIPVVVGSRVRRDILEEASPYVAADGLRKQSLILYPYGMTHYMITTKLSMAMGHLNELIESGRQELELPDVYLRVLQRAMQFDVDGEVNGHPSDRVLGEAVEDIAREVLAKATA